MSDPHRSAAERKCHERAALVARECARIFEAVFAAGIDAAQYRDESHARTFALAASVASRAAAAFAGCIEPLVHGDGRMWAQAWDDTAGEGVVMFDDEP